MATAKTTTTKSLVPFVSDAPLVDDAANAACLVPAAPRGADVSAAAPRTLNATSATTPPTEMSQAIDLDGLPRRLHLPTIRRLYAELQQHAEATQMSYRDYLAALVAEEVAHRTQTRIQRATRKAHFPFLRTIEEFDFTFQTSIRLSLLGSYLGPELVTEGRCVIFAGRPGTGKTHLAVAIAYRAIQNGYDAFFTTAADLIDRLSTAARSGNVADALPTYCHPHVLVIDEIGYLAHSPDAANVLFQVVDHRYLHRRPMIFTTNKPLEQWGPVLHDDDLAEAITDRILERGRLVQLRGTSWRTRHLRPAAQTATTKQRP